MAVLIGVAAGAALTAAIGTTKRGKEVRANLVKKANDLRNNIASDIEKKIEEKESEFIYI